MPTARPTPRDPLPAVAAAVLAALLYAVTLGGTYVYDDVAIVRDDPRVRGTSQWGQLWTRDYANGSGIDNLYRPLVSSSYAVEWWLHGDRPWAFHLVNVLLHAAAAAAVAELARRGTGQAGAAWGAGLLFAAHPVHAEAVANIVGRAELSVAVSLLASLVLLARRPLTTSRAAAVVAGGVVALLCKEQGLLAPILWAAFVAAVWVRPVTDGERPVLRAAAVVLLWVWAAYMAIREHYLKFDWDRQLLVRASQPMFLTTGIDRWRLPIALVGRYAALIAWPLHLSPDYGGDVIGSSTRAADPYLWLGVGVLVAGLLAAIVAWRRRAGFALFCLLALAATYFPVANLATIIGTIFGERLIYLPSAFLALLVGVGLARLPMIARAVLLATLVVPMSILTVRSAAEWNHPHALFTRALRDHPGSIQLHLLVAQVDGEERRPAERGAVLDDACRRFPDYWRCWSARAEAAADVGDFATAEGALDEGLARAFSPQLQGTRKYISDLEAAAHWRPTTTRPTGGR